MPDGCVLQFDPAPTLPPDGNASPLNGWGDVFGDSRQQVEIDGICRTFRGWPVVSPTTGNVRLAACGCDSMFCADPTIESETGNVVWQETGPCDASYCECGGYLFPCFLKATYPQRMDVTVLYTAGAPEFEAPVVKTCGPLEYSSLIIPNSCTVVSGVVTVRYQTGHIIYDTNNETITFDALTSPFTLYAQNCSVFAPCGGCVPDASLFYRYVLTVPDGSVMVGNKILVAPLSVPSLPLPGGYNGGKHVILSPASEGTLAVPDRRYGGGGMFRINNEHTAWTQPCSYTEYEVCASGSAPTGKCCIPPDPICFEATEFLCEALGGEYGGDDTECEAGTPYCAQLPGACCFPEAGCFEGFDEPTCVSGGGIFAGSGTTCDDIECGVGACCYPDGGCSEVSQVSCEAAGGVFRGEGVACSSIECECPACGACCENGLCYETTESGCAGTFMGIGSSCSPDPCDNTVGACCLANNSDCIFTSASVCSAIGGSFSAGIGCEAVECGGGAHIAACCLPGAICEMMTEGECAAAGGIWWPNEACGVLGFNCIFQP